METEVASPMAAVPESYGGSTEKEKSGSTPVHLIRQLGVTACISVTVGTVIGSGIFISPKGTLVNTGSLGASLIVWTLCGALATMGALSYGELGTTFTKSGGDYIYLFESYGPMVAFLRIWTYFVAVRTGSTAVVSLTAATYLHRMFLPDCQDMPYVSVRLIAALIIVIIFYINCVSVPWTTRIQVILTAAKIIGITIIIITGFIIICKGETENFKDPFEKEIEVEWQQIPLAFYAGLFAFSGWQYTPTLAEEIVRPGRTLPLSIIISMLIITTVYLMANVAYFSVLKPLQLIASDAVALSFGQHVFGNFSWIMSMTVALSCIGSINGGIFSISRVVFVAAREGHLPQVMSMVQIHRKTPLPAAALMNGRGGNQTCTDRYVNVPTVTAACISVGHSTQKSWNIQGELPLSLAMIWGENIYNLITYLSFTRWLFVSLTVATIPYFRWKHPEWERPFKVPIFVPITFVVITMLLVIMSLYSSPKECGIGFLILLSGVPVYLVGVRWKNKPAYITEALVKMTIFCQKLFLVVQQETKTY